MWKTMTVWKMAYGTHLDLSHFEIHTGNFLDEFYRSGTEHRLKMVEQEPDVYPNLKPYMLPFLAGMAHKLCNDYEVNCPAWVHKDKYILPEPYFALNAKGTLRLILLANARWNSRSAIFLRQAIV